MDGKQTTDKAQNSATAISMETHTYKADGRKDNNRKQRQRSLKQKMHKFARLTVKQEAKLEKETREEPKPKKSRSHIRISKLASMDNGTMVEAFKFLNYCQLAKNSLVSKRFVDVIRTHRHKLALLYVKSISMGRYYDAPSVKKIFNKELSREEYNEWVVRNNYSKQISLDITALDLQGYELSAYADFKDPNSKKTSVFFARVRELRDHWPLFEHFIRLLSDPFVSIGHVKLIPQKDTFNLLASTIERSNRGRLQCEELEFYYEGNAQKFFNWIKDHVRCGKFQIAISCSSAYRDKQLLDFFATGSHCTSEILITHDHLSKIVLIDFVQKFVDLKNWNESQMVELIRGSVSKPTAEVLQRNYAKFLVNQETDRFGRTRKSLKSSIPISERNCSSPSKILYKSY
ncbi:hypothetical protein DdX_21370 [Ditylenchus destructor]|uniref:Uncharacterized protein n=1 Tax=Ditylenchus destructor TaxID=166010 RepID=A0AAD4MFM5_9BILA|nr:hypothetical protein DdX_21370 [Ditylenchus destructor]